ncbi:MAG: preprotein translocase subunit YajC [Planctomycetota bacterium]
MLVSEILMCLAQAEEGSPTPGYPLQQCGQMAPMLLLMFGVIYFLMIRPQSKEKKRRAEMLAAIKKNDRVTTIGGIMGTVQSVSDAEVTLKVDESSNTKITFSRSAIQAVRSTEAGDAT